MLLIALEGSSFAGKTTISNYLNNIHPDRVKLISEYVIYANGADNFPPFPKSKEDALNNLNFFLQIERKRFEDVYNGIFYYLHLLDRSVLSLLGFNYVLEKEFSIECYKESYDLIINNYRVFIPDIIIYIKTSHEQLVNRQLTSKRPVGEVFVDKNFNRYFHEFFDAIATDKNFNVITINGEKDISLVIKDISQICNVPF